MFSNSLFTLVAIIGIFGLTHSPQILADSDTDPEEKLVELYYDTWDSVRSRILDEVHSEIDGLREKAKAKSLNVEDLRKTAVKFIRMRPTDELDRAISDKHDEITQLAKATVLNAPKLNIVIEDGKYNLSGAVNTALLVVIALLLITAISLQFAVIHSKR